MSNVPTSFKTATKVALTTSLIVFTTFKHSVTMGGPEVNAPLNTPTYTFFGVGRYQYESSQANQVELNNTTVLVAGLEKSWYPFWGSELRYMYGEPNIKHGEQVRFNQLDLNAIFYARPAYAQGWQPYLSVGGGLARLDSDDNLIATLGTGIRWHLTDKIALKADYRLNHVLDEDQSDQVITLGINAISTQKPETPTVPANPYHRKKTSNVKKPNSEHGLR